MPAGNFVLFAFSAAAATLAVAHAEPARREPDRPAPLRSVRSMLEMRHDRVVLQQWDLSCGAAALATLLSIQHNDAVSEREIALALMRRDAYLADPDLVRVREGFSLLDLKRFVQARGYEGVGLGRLSMADIAGRAPFIAPLSINGYNHFVVVIGVRDGRVMIADPAFGNRDLAIAAFERAWIDSPRMGRVAFIVRRPGVAAPPPSIPAPLAPDGAMLRAQGRRY
ncbi:MAG: C39 family peptidase [Hyphomonadaceae bacterium]|nr:C39 family peptidase [Hyphomonadaceae bacterium]